MPMLTVRARLGLLLVAHESRRFACSVVENPVVDHVPPLVRRDRDHVPGSAMELDEGPEVEIREQISVHHEEGTVETGHQAERAGRPERLVLVDVAEPGGTLTAREDRLDEVGQVAHAERDVLDAAFDQAVDSDLDDSPVTDRHQRLRQHGRVRFESPPASAGEDDRSHPEIIDRHVRTPFSTPSRRPQSSEDPWATARPGVRNVSADGHLARPTVGHPGR